MKSSLFKFTIAAALVLGCLPALYAEEGLYAGVRFRTVSPDRMSDYLDGERGFWKLAHTEASKEVSLHSWQVLIRAQPYGPELPYHAITFNIRRGAESGYGAAVQSVLAKMSKDKAHNKLRQQTESASRLHHGELWQLVEEVWGADKEVGEDENVYAQLGFMKTHPGQVNAYREIEKEWKKIHQEAVKAGASRGWQFFSVRFPTGSEAEYNFVTVSYFNGLSFLDGRRVGQFFEKAYPGKDFAELGRRTRESRSSVRRELYRVATDIR